VKVLVALATMEMVAMAAVLLLVKRTEVLPTGQVTKLVQTAEMSLIQMEILFRWEAMAAAELLSMQMSSILMEMLLQSVNMENKAIDTTTDLETEDLVLVAAQEAVLSCCQMN
jgi:hypothetical protein